MATVFVYITAPSLDEAQSLGRELVERRLAACVNCIEGMRSIYQWQGKIEEAEEVVLIAKTRSDLVDALTRAVKELHSYQVPCIVAVPILGGNADFLAWIEDETRP